MKINWFLPLRLGAVLGVFAGLAITCRDLWLHRFLSYHLYYTSAKMLALALDQWVVTCIAVCYFLTMVSSINGRFRRKNLTSVTGLLMLTAIVGLQSPGHSTDGTDAGTSQLLSHADIVRVVSAVVCVCAGILVLRWLRRHPEITARILRMAQIQLVAAKRVALSVFYPCLILLVLANGTAAVLFETTRLAVNDKPNIIFIMVDTLRADHLGCYGYHVNTSPNIDRLAGESTRFERSISQAPMTGWSVPSFLTSQYPEDLNRLNTGQLITDTTLTLAKVLKDQGYATAGLNSNGGVSGLEYGFDSFASYDLDTGSSSPWVLKNAEKQLDSLKDRKFFLFLLFMDPHSPYDLHDQYDFSRQYRNESTKSVCTSFGSDGHEYSAREKQLQQPYYDSEIRFTDEHIGRLLEKLKQMRLYDDSLIVFLADHGEEFHEHGYYFHGMTVYNQALSVPCIIKLPKQRQGNVVKGVFRSLDIFPTIMRVLHCDSSAMNLRGTAQDLSNLKEIPDRTIFSASNVDNQRSANTFRYKYIMKPSTDKEELYDVLKDPTEKVDISSQEPDIIKSMRAAVLARGAESSKLGQLKDRAADLARMTEEQKQRLRNLGYLAN